MYDIYFYQQEYSYGLRINRLLQIERLIKNCSYIHYMKRHLLVNNCSFDYLEIDIEMAASQLYMYIIIALVRIK